MRSSGNTGISRHSPPVSFIEEANMNICLRPSHFVLLAAGSLALSAAESRGDAPRAVPTFHCLGLYWSPPGGSADKEVLVRYRPRGVPGWKQALAMRHNPIPGTDEDLADYRGSIVQLAPATTYEVELTLGGTSTTANLTATTWAEDFPAGEA